MDEKIFSSFSFLLVRLVRAHRSLVRHEMQALGLHRGQPHVLFALQKQDGRSNSELSSFLEITPATLTNKVKRMEKAGLVQRRRDPEDERISRIYLTDKGHGIMDTLRASMQEIEDVLLRGFTDAEVERLKADLRQVVDNLEAYSPGIDAKRLE